MSQLQLLSVSDNKEVWLKELQSTYFKKINHFIKFEIVLVKPYREAREQTQDKILKEGLSLLRKIETNDYVVVCDEHGKESSSVQFAKKLEALTVQVSQRRIVFIIGGAYGLSDGVKERAQEKIKLSGMTMNHHMAQAMLLEQIYRAFTIIKGIPYHNV